MKCFLIYANTYKDKDLAVTKRICDFLKQAGQRAAVVTSGDGGEETESFSESLAAGRAGQGKLFREKAEIIVYGYVRR